jgi:hypothetical protein
MADTLKGKIAVVAGALAGKTVVPEVQANA